MALAVAMAEKLSHRGPDEAGSFLSTDRRCAIGFRRLSVIDPPGSHQPMTDKEAGITVAFNGEIYNFRTLRENLIRGGARFRTAGDTEVLLHLYREYGEEMVHHIDGMFAFVIYDAPAGKLFLVRDRLGQKPLWYAVTPQRLLFASEPKALLACGRLSGEESRCAISSYLASGYIGYPSSVWTQISKLSPACTMAATDSLGQPKRYWQPALLQEQPSSADWVDLVRKELSAAVEARMVSDVPLGALLSGGLDSSIIVALMSQAAEGGRAVRTFTAGFDEAEFDERPLARLVAKHCRTVHTELHVKPPSPDMIDRLVDIYDEPFADSSAIPTLLICQAAREYVTVALAGDGGDEVFGGYDRYRALHLAAQMSPAQYFFTRLAAGIVRPFASKAKRSGTGRLLRFADALPYPPAGQYYRYRSIFTTDDLSRLFTEDFAAAADIEKPEQDFLELYEQGDWPDEISRAQYHDLMDYLPNDLLVKADMASMACSLELRAPMLDHRLVSLGLSLPADMKISKRCGKMILRQAFGDLLPLEIFQQPKRGFGVPLAKWLREEFREVMLDTLLDRDFLNRGIFREKAIVGLMNDHLSGRDDHAERLWALLVLARWLARR